MMTPLLNRPVAIDLFSGAGGLSLGFREAGFEILAAVESDRWAAETYRLNHPGVSMFQADVRTVPSGSLSRQLRGRGASGRPSAVIAGAPCQGFSESNRVSRNMRNKSNLLYREFTRVVRDVSPTVCVFENVVGIKTVDGGQVLSRLVHELRDSSYAVQVIEVNAADWGVPQNRRRVFVVGCRTGKDYVASHSQNIRRVTVRDAIADLPSLAVGAAEDVLPYGTEPLSDYQRDLRRNASVCVSGNLVTRNSEQVLRRYSFIGEGENWAAIPARLMRNYADRERCHTGIYHRLVWDEPAKVLGNFRKNMIIHPLENRGLSIREAARLQSFPDWYKFVGSIGFQQQQIADAVPPLLAQRIASSLLDCL
jgi:DNA (cytosine-5)-methyltransferase 1